MIYEGFEENIKERTAKGNDIGKNLFNLSNL